MTYVRILWNLRAVRVYLNRHLDWIEDERRKDHAAGTIWHCYERWAYDLGRILGRRVVEAP